MERDATTGEDDVDQTSGSPSMTLYSMWWAFLERLRCSSFSIGASMGVTGEDDSSENNPLLFVVLAHELLVRGGMTGSSSLSLSSSSPASNCPISSVLLALRLRDTRGGRLTRYVLAEWCLRIGLY